MSKIKRKIRQEVSQITDILIPENQWERYINLMDRDNKFTRKNLISIIMVMCQELELFENLLDDIYFQLDLSQGKNTSIKQYIIKLRTLVNIYADLIKLKKEETKAFYISLKDWEILAANVDPILSKTKSEYGYGIEVDPIDGKEKTCLYYLDLPIFKK